MRGSDSIVRLHRLDDLFIQTDAARHTTRHNRFETDRRQLIFRFYRATLLQFSEAILHRFRIIRHPLESALVQKTLAILLEIEQAPLERSGTEIRDKDFHGQWILLWGERDLIEAICPGRRDL